MPKELRNPIYAAELKEAIELDNVPNLDTRDRNNHTGQQAISTITGLQSILDGLVSPFDTDTYDEQIDSTYMYYGWERLDATGYFAERWSLDPPGPAGTTTGVLPMPANLTTLTYT